MLRKSFELFCGSVVVYLAVAACGSSGGPGAPVASNAGEPGRGGSPSRGGSSGTGNDDGGFGGFTDPVPDAGAAEAGEPGMCDCPEPPDPYVPPEPLVVEADCDVFIEVTTSLDYVYAVIPRPASLSEAQLSMGHVVLQHSAQPSYLPPGGFTRFGGGLAFSDDSVLANCGNVASGTPAHASKARFVFPR